MPNPNANSSRTNTVPRAAVRGPIAFPAKLI
jgi:hypothetical protein